MYTSNAYRGSERIGRIGGRLLETMPINGAIAIVAVVYAQHQYNMICHEDDLIPKIILDILKS